MEAYQRANFIEEAEEVRRELVDLRAQRALEDQEVEGTAGTMSLENLLVSPTR